MKRTSLIIITCILAVALISAGYYKYSYLKVGYGLPSISELPPLDKGSILEAAQGDHSSILISFQVVTFAYVYYGYVFSDGECVFLESLWSTQLKDELKDKIAAGDTEKLTEEFIKIVEGAPDGNYSKYYSYELSDVQITQLLEFLAGQEIYDVEKRIQSSEQGIQYALALYLNNKVALFRGDLYSGYNGTVLSPFEGVNIEVYEYLTETLMPAIRSEGEELSGHGEYANIKLDNIKDYPFTVLFDRNDADRIISGDFSLWGR